MTEEEKVPEDESMIFDAARMTLYEIESFDGDISDVSFSPESLSFEDIGYAVGTRELSASFDISTIDDFDDTPSTMLSRSREKLTDSLYEGHEMKELEATIDDVTVHDEMEVSIIEQVNDWIVTSVDVSNHGSSNTIELTIEGSIYDFEHDGRPTFYEPKMHTTAGRIIRAVKGRVERQMPEWDHRYEDIWRYVDTLVLGERQHEALQSHADGKDEAPDDIADWFGGQVDIIKVPGPMIHPVIKEDVTNE